MKDQSRVNWEIPKGPTSLEHVQTGSMQRIADAAERMAGAAEKMTIKISDLEKDRDYYKGQFYASIERNNKLLRRVSALQGVITKLKKAKQKQ